MIKSNRDLLKLTPEELLNEIPTHKKLELRNFENEMHRREYQVRFQKSCDYDGYEVLPENAEHFNVGFKVEGKAVPYWTPSRMWHDEVLWLDREVYYHKDATFEDKIINASLVKFYGPSNTINIISRNSDRPFVQYEKLVNDEDYLLTCMKNIHEAMDNGEKIWGTTELRTSLQTSSRNYTRDRLTPYDKYLGIKNDPERKGRSSDMLYWFTYMGPRMVEFYRTKPTMEESFDFLTSHWGIGNYYGYHLSTNFARMPEVGSIELLKPNSLFGNLSEDDDFVAPGVGAMITINDFYKHLGFAISEKVGAKVIIAIRDSQEEFFELIDNVKYIHNTVLELGRLTTFGTEISCCQFGIFNRLRNNPKLAKKRSQAPMSLEKFDPLYNKEEVKDKADTQDIATVEKKMPAIGDMAADCVLQLRRQEQLFDNLFGSVDNLHIAPLKINKDLDSEKPKEKEVQKEIIETPVKKEKKIKTIYNVDKRHVDIVWNMIMELELKSFPHKVIGDEVAKRDLPFKQDTNWKESWQILQVLVEQEKLEKDGRHYTVAH